MWFVRNDNSFYVLLTWHVRSWSINISNALNFPSSGPFKKALSRLQNIRKCFCCDVLVSLLSHKSDQKSVEIQKGSNVCETRLTLSLTIHHSTTPANCDFSIEFYRVYTTISMSLLHYTIYGCQQFRPIHWTTENNSIFCRRHPQYERPFIAPIYYHIYMTNFVCIR